MKCVFCYNIALELKVQECKLNAFDRIYDPVSVTYILLTFNEDTMSDPEDISVLFSLHVKQVKGNCNHGSSARLVSVVACKKHC
jgi:hypothetical protein